MMHHQELYFKRAALQDSDLLLEWANEEETRRQSFHSRRISVDEHFEWFRNILADQNTVLLILYWGETPIGNMRFSMDGSCASLSYSIDSRFRGKGFGKALIQLAVNYAKETLHVQTLLAETKPDNFASQKVLLENGFHEVKQEEKGKRVFINNFSLDRVRYL